VTSLRITLPKAAEGRVHVFDEIKGVAILLIVLYHAGGVLIWRDVLHGESGVDMFVIASGIGLALSPAREGALRFLARRLWRLYPTYWIVLTAFLVANTHILGYGYTVRDMVLHYLGIHALFGDAYAMSINDSFWFITLIVCLYVVYAFLRRLMDRPDWVLFIGAVLSVAAALGTFYGGMSAVFGHLALRAPGFFVGLLIGHAVRTAELNVSLSAVLGLAFLLVFYVPYANGFIFASVWVGLALMAGYAFALEPVLPGVARAALRRLGEWSLEIFLIHQPLFREYNTLVYSRLFHGAAETTWTLVAGMFIGLAVTIVMSCGLHALVRRLPVPWKSGPSQART
jgi:peptidoglycan/LPS O-acetylase OafA/YrhL